MTHDDNIKLAIVIPYYKITYFEGLLRSLTKQSNQLFKVYVGDDCSKHSPIETINKYKNQIEISYTRFENNLGSTCLTKQWDRCVALANGEEWVWILPDDDLPAKNCVEEFYCALPVLKKNSVRVVRFAMEIIDGSNNSNVSVFHEENPFIENNLAFYSRLLKGKTASSLGDNIFHHRSLIKKGGFVDFPKAWGSDHATVLKVSSFGNIAFLRNATFFFRMSDENISSIRSDGLVKLKSRILFAKWLKLNENIFPETPSNEFYKFFYFKAEYYVIHHWNFNILIFKKLHELQRICLSNHSKISVIKVLIKKIFRQRKQSNSG